MAIKFYRLNGPYGYMSNFKDSPMFLRGRWWKNVETPFQAFKTLDQKEYDTVWQAPTASKARELGQKVKLRPDWEQVKYDIMKECVLAKFIQNHDLRAQLLETKDEFLIEDSPIDWTWGCGSDGTGKNYLGQILMEVRSLLKDDPSFKK